MPTADAAQSELSLEQNTRLQVASMLIGDLSSPNKHVVATLEKAHAITNFVLQGRATGASTILRSQSSPTAWVVAYVAELEGWVVEAIGPEGEMYVAQFYGPDADVRAKEYAEWKAALSTQPLGQST